MSTLQQVHCFLVPACSSHVIFTVNLLLILRMAGLASCCQVAVDILMWYNFSSPVGPRWICRMRWDTSTKAVKDTPKWTPWLINMKRELLVSPDILFGPKCVPLEGFHCSNHWLLMSPYVPETTFDCLMQNKEAMESVHLLLGIHYLRQMILVSILPASLHVHAGALE